MHTDQILQGHTYQGRCMDADKTRTVEALHQDIVINRVRRDGQDLGVTETSLALFAAWAMVDVTTTMQQDER
jgi:hypothetical protein